jgi:dTDP-4-dehydrorhamnose reductase
MTSDHNKDCKHLRLVVIGQRGQLLRAIEEKASKYDIEFVALGRPGLDLMFPESVHQTLSARQPSIIINPAAYTAVDSAEKEPDLAMRINGEGAGAIARSAHIMDVPVIHLSTDYVFDGCKESPYLEDDPVGPINSYGRSKLEGERQVRMAAAKHVILRTSRLFSPMALTS